MKPCDYWLLLCAILTSIFIRLITLPAMLRGDGVNVIGNDAWYVLRQVDVLKHCGEYGWFDVWTNFPVGHEVFWGPLTASLISDISMLATDRAGIAFFGGFFPVVCGAFCVLLVFWIVSRFYDTRVALASAFCVALIGGGYLFRTLYGNLDHHAIESVISLVFIAYYVWSHLLCQKGILQISKSYELNQTLTAICDGLILGLIYLIGFMNMPTIAYLGLVGVIAYTVSVFLIKDKRYLNDFTIMNLTMWATILLSSALFVSSLAIRHAGGMARYSYSHISLYAVALIWVAVLYVGVRIWRNRGITSERSPVGISTYLVLGASITLLAMCPCVRGYFLTAVSNIWDILVYVFGSSAATNTIGEAQSLFLHPPLSFIVFIPLSLLGFYSFVKEWVFCDKELRGKIAAIYVIIWAIVTLFMLIIHTRYEYLGAPIVALFAGIGAIALINIGSKCRSTFGINIGALIVSGVLIISLALSVVGAIGASNEEFMDYKDDWKDALYWLKDNSIPVDMNYLSGDRQDLQGYGVGAWWDYGHMITYFGERPAIANPFQNNADTMARFFVTGNESEAMEIVNQTRMGYVIVDTRSANGAFNSFLTWAGEEQSEYHEMTESGRVYYQPFYDSMVNRLYLFDGLDCAGAGGNSSYEPMAPPSDVSHLDHFKLVYSTDNMHVKIFEII